MLTCQSRSPEERLSNWREFRVTLEEITDDERITEVVNFFSSTPYGSRTLDFYTPGSWPTPWEILHYETYCKNSISLLMYYSLSMIRDFSKDLELWIIDTSDDRYLVPVIDNQFILNYELGQISTVQDLKTRIKIIDRFDSLQIKQIN